MGQKVMGLTMSAGSSCGDAIIGMSPDESVLILINHCRDMKKQEARLRLITLLVLLVCAVLFVFSTCADLRQHEKSGSAGEQASAYSKQERGCLAVTDPENVQSEVETLRIHLKSVAEVNATNGSYVKWNLVFGKKHYSEERRAIVIPVTGFYFIYLRFALICHEKVREEGFQNFQVQLHRWSEGYPKVTLLTEAWESVKCWPENSPQDYRGLFVGQLFELETGDHVSVNVTAGYHLIKTSLFGAFLE